MAIWMWVVMLGFIEELEKALAEIDDSVVGDSGSE